MVGMTVLSTLYIKWFCFIGDDFSSSSNSSVWIIPELLKLSIFSFNLIYSIGLSASCAIFSFLRRYKNTSDILNKIDAWGFTCVGYIIFVMLMEGCLLHEHMNSRGDYYLYSDTMVIITSFCLVGMTHVLKRRQAIKELSYLLSMSLSIGKGIASMIECDTDLTKHVDFISSSTAATLFLFVLGAPYIIMKTNHLSETHGQHFGKKPRLIPQKTSIYIALYCFVILPLSIICSLSILRSVINMVMDGFRETYYSRPLNIVEAISCSMLIWGSCVLLMLNHHLPNGCAAAWTNGALLSFILGLFLYIISSTFSIFDDCENISLFLFASLSSAGSTRQRQDEKGVWGLVVAFLSLLIPLSGPMTLPKYSASRREGDKIRGVRFTFFCLMFSCGSTWFLVFQCYDTFSTFETVVHLVSSMLISLIYTSTIVSSITETLKRSDVVKMGETSMYVASACSVCSTITFNFSANGAGIHMSILLLFWAFYSFLLGLSIRRRSQSTSNMNMRSLGNLCFVISWLLPTTVVYGYFGIASIDVGSKYDQILGIPVSQS